MAFYKQKKKDQMIQTVFSNQAEKRFIPQKKYYALIKIGEHLFYEEYEGKFRSEAKEYFEEFSRLNQGKVDTFSVLK
jgi:hypothetical protein